MKEFFSTLSVNDRPLWHIKFNVYEPFSAWLIFNPATKQVLNNGAPPKFKFPIQQINELESYFCRWFVALIDSSKMQQVWQHRLLVAGKFASRDRGQTGIVMRPWIRDKIHLELGWTFGVLFFRPSSCPI